MQWLKGSEGKRGGLVETPRKYIKRYGQALIDQCKTSTTEWSSLMPEISLTKIKVDVARRQREDVGDIQELATSIEKYGQLAPILLDNDFNLVAGMRRLLAVGALGWDTIGI